MERGGEREREREKERGRGKFDRILFIDLPDRHLRT